MNNEPKVNEVWETKHGRYVLIIPSNLATVPPKMLWWDEVENNFNVTEILERLERKTKMSVNDWWGYIWAKIPK